jgi:hypothetical protein
MERLSDVKRYLKVGAVVRCTAGPKSGKLRQVIKVHSQFLEFAEPGDIDVKRGSRLDFPRTSLLEVNETGFKIYQPGNRDLTPEEKAFKENEPRDQKQAEIDMMTDTNTMWYRRLAYYRGTEFEHLFQDKNGKRFDFNTKQIIDPAVKGDLVLAYEFINP